MDAFGDKAKIKWRFSSHVNQNIKLCYFRSLSYTKAIGYIRVDRIYPIAFKLDEQIGRGLLIYTL